MKLEELKKGDKITIQYGSSLRKAKVLENFPNQNRLYLRINLVFWGLVRTKVVKDYGSYYFDLLRE